MGLISVPSLENSMGFVGLGMSGERFTRTCVGLPHALLMRMTSVEEWEVRVSSGIQGLLCGELCVKQSEPGGALCCV